MIDGSPLILHNETKFFWPHQQNRTNETSSPSSSASTFVGISSDKFYNKPQITANDEMANDQHEDDLINRQTTQDQCKMAQTYTNSKMSLFDSIERDFLKNSPNAHKTNDSNSTVEKTSNTNHLFDELDHIESNKSELSTLKEDEHNKIAPKNNISNSCRQATAMEKETEQMDDPDVIPGTPEKKSKSLRKSSQLKQMKLHDIFKRD